MLSFRNPVSLGNWLSGTYLLPHLATSGNSAGPTGGALHFIPYIFPETRVISFFAVGLVTAQTGAECHVGLYSDISGYPGNLISNDLTLSLASGTNAKIEGAATATGGGSLIAVRGARAWGGYMVKAANPQATVVRMATPSGLIPDTTLPSAGTLWRSLSAAGFTYGSGLPTTQSGLTLTAVGTNDSAIVWLKAA